MTAADKIAEARALIEPLTGHDAGPWDIEDDDWDGLHITTTQRLEESYTPIAKVSVDFDEPFETQQQSCARLIAAAPSLRDTVAALVDLADVLAQENAKLRDALEWAEDELASYAPDPAFRNKITDDVLRKVRATLSPTPSPENAQ